MIKGNGLLRITNAARPSTFKVKHLKVHGCFVGLQCAAFIALYSVSILFDLVGIRNAVLVVTFSVLIFGLGMCAELVQNSNEKLGLSY